jgi:hypothetical protein
MKDPAANPGANPPAAVSGADRGGWLDRLQFVVSAPRSGSTWLTTALNYHPQIFATEQRMFGKFCEIWKNNDGSSSPRLTFDSYSEAFAVHYFFQFLGMNRGTFLREFQTQYAEFLVQFALQHSRKELVVDKITPYQGTCQYVFSRLSRLFPQAAVVHLIRDGRDVLTSGTFDWLQKDARDTERYRFFVQRDPGLRLVRFFDDQVIEKWAGLWLESIEACHRQTRQANGNLIVTYESMKKNMGAELQRIFRYLQVADDASIAAECARQASFQSLTGREPGILDPTAKIRKGIAGDWRNYFTRRDGELFQQIAGSGLIACGYASDAGWTEDLPEQLNLIADGT